MNGSEFKKGGMLAAQRKKHDANRIFAERSETAKISTIGGREILKNNRSPNSENSPSYRKRKTGCGLQAGLYHAAKEVQGEARRTPHQKKTASRLPKTEALQKEDVLPDGWKPVRAKPSSSTLLSPGSGEQRKAEASKRGLKSNGEADFR